MTDLRIEGPQYDNREGFAIIDWDKVDYDNDGALVKHLDEEQAQYALMLLENEGLGDLEGLGRMDVSFLIEEACERVENERGEIVFRAETREWAM